MKRRETAFRRRRGEQGQVLILAVVALVLVIIAVLLLFDVQTVIRGKVKAQNGVDAAALTAAEWQKHSLNLIGELNLVRATGTLISDPFFANGILNAPADQTNSAEFFSDLPMPITQENFTLFPEREAFYNPDGTINTDKLVEEVVRVEKEKRYLDALNSLVSQLQARLSFVGPLIGFGAAQQAAKNNGITYDDDTSEFFIYYLNLVGNDGIYQNITPVFVKDYAWRAPYVTMLNSILDYSIQHNDITGYSESRAYGIAAGTKFKFVGMPSLTTNPPTDLSVYLGNKHFYEMIHGRDWCGLDRLLRLDFNGNWWGDFECEFDENFSNQSEILPLHIEFSDSTAPYENANKTNVKAFDRYIRNGEKLFSETFNREVPYEYTVSDDIVKREETEERRRTFYTFTNISITIDRPLSTYNDEDADRRYDLLPRLTWAVYDSEWAAYDEDKKEWEEYLRGKFKPGMDYQSGALAYFEAEQQTVTISGSMGRPPRSSYAPDVGQVFASARTNGEAQRVSSALRRMNNNSISKIETNAEAKPIGCIKTRNGNLRPFEAGRMILPVFTETALIPIALEPVDGFSMLDLDWLYYLTEFVPLLSGSPSLEDAWMRAMVLYPNHLGHYSYYVSALGLLNDPDFRKAGLDWLDATATWRVDANGRRHPLQTNREVYCTGRSGGSGGGGWHGIYQSNGGPSKLH